MFVVPLHECVTNGAYGTGSSDGAEETLSLDGINATRCLGVIQVSMALVPDPWELDM
jgi:hypothetical protein